MVKRWKNIDLFHDIVIFLDVPVDDLKAKRHKINASKCKCWLHDIFKEDLSIRTLELHKYNDRLNHMTLCTSALQNLQHMDGRPLKESVLIRGAECDPKREPSGRGDALREGSSTGSVRTAGTWLIPHRCHSSTPDALKALMILLCGRSLFIWGPASQLLLGSWACNQSCQCNECLFWGGACRLMTPFTLWAAHSFIVSLLPLT